MSLGKDEFKKTISKYISMTLEDLENEYAQLKLKQTRALDAIVITLIIKAIKTQDLSTIEWLAVRSVGKPKEEIELDLNVKHTVHSEIMSYINENRSRLKDIGEPTA